MQSSIVLRAARQQRVFGASLLIVLALAACLVASLGKAFAHSEYESSTPGKSESVGQSPARVDMYLTLDLFKREGENEIQVFDEASNRVDDTNTVVDDNNRRHMYVALQPNLPAGRYVVRWKTLSDDDQETFGGAFAFYIGVTPTADQLHEDREIEEQAELEFEEQEPTAEPASTEAATPSPTITSASEDDDDGGGASVGLIVGVVVAVIAVAAVGGGAVAINRWRRA